MSNQNKLNENKFNDNSNLQYNITESFDSEEKNSHNVDKNIQGSKGQIISHKVKPGIVRIKNIKNIIAVTSGKGGVGKSTVALNLAVSLKQCLGANVGLLDADIYGPSIPTLVGEKDFKPEVEDACFIPLQKFGLKILSFGFLIDEKQPAIWRGAIVNKAIDQLLYDTKWGDLDFLIIDMPPGTGDIHLSMCQKMPITAVVTVTTPQDIALVDVKKSIAMYQKMTIPCLGIVENMSTHICSKCGHNEDIFGIDGANKLSKEYELEILAKLPLNIAIREACDIGKPVILSENNSKQTIAQLANIKNVFESLVEKLLSQLKLLPKDYSTQIGKINVIKD